MYRKVERTTDRKTIILFFFMMNEAVIAEVPIYERSVRSMNRFNPVVKFSLAVELIRDATAKIGKFSTTSIGCPSI